MRKVLVRALGAALVSAPKAQPSLRASDNVNTAAIIIIITAEGRGL